jgi:cytochrome-b5 reductase
MAEKEYSIGEIEKHNKKEDLWLVIVGKVYDVTKFSLEHPGGLEPLMEQTGGKDATEAFKE